MSKSILGLLLIILLACFTRCKPKDNKNIENNENVLQFATTFELYPQDSGWVYQTVNQELFIPKKNIPYKNILLLSSSPAGYLSALGAVEQVSYISAPQYIYQPIFHQKIKEKQIQTLPQIGLLNFEMILETHPDLIITNSQPEKSRLFTQLQQMGIPILMVDEYLEKNPLGKAEYLKLFGAITGKMEKANQIFEEVTANYQKWKTKAQKTTKKPTVFAEIMRGDVWYMPSGNSFAANFIADAGGEYLWQETQQTGSLHLSFEEVYERAKNANIWLNVSDLENIQQLKESYHAHTWFNAFKNRKVYAYTKRKNEQFANDYFEMGSVRPDWVLKDLIKILHPQILPAHDFVFYQKLSVDSID